MHIVDRVSLVKYVSGSCMMSNFDLKLISANR